MGGMHAWMWAEMYPDLMDGVVALSCQPVEISGRNWLGRRAAAEAIRNDPDWNGGFYDKQPQHYRYSAAGNFNTESPTRIQEMAPTLAVADALYERRLAESGKGDANDALWAIEAIRDYNPEPNLDKIKAKVLLINDADDHANPPELGTVERAMKRVKAWALRADPGRPRHARPFQPFLRQLWKPYLIEFLASLDPPQHAAAAE
jgi:homoserine O-acetyltransferase